MMKLDLTIAEMCDILETAPVNVPARTLRRKVTLCMDSREADKGCVFWPICGERFDAHKFVKQVEEKGAVMSVVNEAKVAEGQFAAYAPVADTTESLLKLAKGYQRRFKLKKVGITGSNGKTTTKEMTKAVLSRKYNTMATEGNFNNHIGVPLTLFRLKHENEAAIVEMGTSGPNEIKPLSMATEPNIAVITNIGASHLERLKDLDGVFREKITIAAGLQKNGLLIVNADDPHLTKVRATKNYKVVSFGIRRGMIKAENVVIGDDGCAMFKVGRTVIHLNVPGIHNVYNALAAFAVGEAMRVPKAEIAKALNGFKATGMRMEIRQGNGFRVVSDCYNANPNSTRMAISTIGSLDNANRRIAVLGDMLELGKESVAMHKEIGGLIPESNFNMLLTIGDRAKDIARGAIAKGFPKKLVKHFENQQDLLCFLAENVCIDDIVLVKGSHGMHLERVVDSLLKMEAVGV